jgi:hypothetical protein
MNASGVFKVRVGWNEAVWGYEGVNFSRTEGPKLLEYAACTRNIATLVV